MTLEAAKRASQNRTYQAQLEANEKEKEETKQHTGDIIGLFKNISSEMTDIAFSSANENNQILTDNKISQLEKEREHELQNTRLTKAQQKAINEKFDKEEAKIKRENAKKQRDNEVDQAIVNGLLAITAVLADPTLYGFTKAIALATAVTTNALAVAKIESRPLPTFAKGVERLKGPGSRTSDSILAGLSVDERVVDAETNIQYFPILSAIHNKKISPQIANALVDSLPYHNISQNDLAAISMMGGIAIDYDKLGREVAKHFTGAIEDSEHRNRNKSRNLVEAIEKLKPEPVEINLRRK